MGLKRRAPQPEAKFPVTVQADETLTVTWTAERAPEEPAETAQTVPETSDTQTPAEDPEELTEANEAVSEWSEKALKQYEATRPENYGYVGRANCIAFVECHDKDGNVIMGPKGPMYNVRQVPPQKGTLYCTECHDYVKFKALGDTRICTQCGISTNDCYIKTANGLWPAQSSKK